MSWVSLSLCDYMFQIVQYSHFLASLKLREDVTGPWLENNNINQTFCVVILQ